MSPPAQLYDEIGVGYGSRRRPDPRIGAAILRALGDARSVVNVGAGAGSYEPSDRSVVAVEPSNEMIRQRRDPGTPVVRASATHLPFADAAFDAALAILTIHHWPDVTRGIAELGRVARRHVVILTFDPGARDFWLIDDYFPEIAEADRRALPPVERLCDLLGRTETHPLPVPHDCVDGFLGAYWRRPDAYLDAGVRNAISSFALLGDVKPGLDRLRSDLEDGSWARRHADLLQRTELDLGYRLLIARSEETPP